MIDGTTYPETRYQLRGLPVPTTTNRHKAVPSVNKVAQELKDLKQAAAQAYLPTDVPLSTAIDTTRAHRHQPTADTPDSVSHVRGAGAFAFTDKEWKV